MFHEASSDVRIWVTAAAQLRDAYIAQGFSRAEAIDLLKTHILAGTDS